MAHRLLRASVAIGLASLRRSHVRLCCTYLARLRRPTHLLEYPHWASLRTPEVAAAAKTCRHRARHRFQTSFRRMDFASSGDWDSGNPAFAVSRGSRDALLRTPGHSRRFPGMLLSLNTLSSRGQPSDSRTFLRVLPDCVGNTTERLAAQFRHITRIPRRAALDAWTRPPVSWHAIFPVHPFGPRVSHQIPRHLLSSLPATRAIQRCASWRSYNGRRPHRALQLRPAAPRSPLPGPSSRPDQTPPSTGRTDL